MELEEIVSRIAELIPVVDSTTNIQVRNRRNKRPYVKGVATLFEPQFTKEVVRCWQTGYPSELSWINDEHPYPDSRETCDLVITDSSVEVEFGSFEWAIELKFLRLVGNNGNNNDYVMQKAISPFLKVSINNSDAFLNCSFPLCVSVPTFNNPTLTFCLLKTLENISEPKLE